MKFSDNFVDQVRNTVDIVRVISECVRLRKVGSNYIGLCPFHTEKTPSFHVHQSRQLYYCFGCHAGGDVFKFIQGIERVTFPEALKFLAEKHGIPVPESDFNREPDQMSKERLMLLDIHQKATKIFRIQLRNSNEGKQALNYLKERGLSEETIEKFDIGYALSHSGTVFYQLSAEFSLETLLKSGLIQGSDYGSHYYDRFRKRIIFPIRNEAGKVVAFGGRILGEGQPKYLNSAESLIYSKSKTLYALDQTRESIRRKNFVILVEGYMDCIALNQAGVDNVVASCGTSLTEHQAKLLSRFTDKIVVNFDPDSAGATAALRSLNIFLDNGFKIRVLTLPDGDDPDAFVKKNGVEGYLRLLERAPLYFDYLLEKARKENDVETVEGKIASVNMMLPYLVRISNRIERVEQVKRVAEIFGIEESMIREELKSAINQNREKLEIDRSHLKAELKYSEKHLLKAILNNEQAAAEIIAKLAASQDYIGLQSENLFHELIAVYQQEGRINLTDFQGKLQSDRDKDFLNQALFTEFDQQQVLGCLEGIKLQKIKQEIDRLQKQIKEEDGRSQNLELLASLDSKKKELKLKEQEIHVSKSNVGP